MWAQPRLKSMLSQQAFSSEIERAPIRPRGPGRFPQLCTIKNCPIVTYNLDRANRKRTINSCPQTGSNPKRQRPAQSAPLTSYFPRFYPQVVSIQDFARRRADTPSVTTTESGFCLGCQKKSVPASAPGGPQDHLNALFIISIPPKAVKGLPWHSTTTFTTCAARS